MDDQIYLQPEGGVSGKTTFAGATMAVPSFDREQIIRELKKMHHPSVRGHDNTTDNSVEPGEEPTEGEPEEALITPAPEDDPTSPEFDKTDHPEQGGYDTNRPATLDEIDWTFGLGESLPGLAHLATIEGPYEFTRGLINGTQFTRDHHMNQCDVIVHDHLI